MSSLMQVVWAQEEDDFRHCPLAQQRPPPSDALGWPMPTGSEAEMQELAPSSCAGDGAGSGREHQLDR